MPRKKRSGQSPARVPGLSEQAAGGSRLHGPEGAMAGSFPHGPSMPSSAKEAIVRNMQEMFSHLDPEVIYIVLSECDFKAENAMDSLLELSVAAEVAGPQPPDVSGFELTAAALLAPHHSEPSAHPDHPKPFRSSLSPLTVELDLLIDEGLKTLTSQPMDKKNLSKGVVADYAGPLSSFPTPPVVQQALPELLQSSLDPGARGISDKRQSPGGIALGEQTPGTSSPLDKLSSWEGEDFKAKESVLDFTHLISETASTKPNPPLDLAASGRPSAFQVYKKQDQPRAASESPGAMSPGEMAGGTRSKKGAQSWQPPGNMSPSWNLEAPAFLPQIRGNQPTFITPVAILPSPWDTQTRPVSHWMTHQPASQTPHKLTATFPQSWALPPPPAQGFIPHSRLRLEGKVLVLLRGAPGSGKSTLARAMLEQNPGGVVLSTDDYFNRHGEYRYDPSVLGEAHEWNHKRAKEAFENGANPIIIDNTNMHGWEMKAYVAQALKHHYKVLFREPDTWWKRKPRELVRRTKHSVPLEKIRHMLEYYERFVSVQSIMDSHPVHQESRPLQPRPSGTPCPDLVGQHGLAQATEKSRPPVLSSLPDVSSIRLSEDMGMAEHGRQNTPETLNNLTCEDEQENCVVLNKDDDEMDLLELDTELDAHLELHPLSTDQGIPDCIVESVLNEDLYCDEVPVAFSESIGQRVKRERQRRKPDHDGPEPVDLVKDTNQSGREEEGVEEHGRKEVEGAVGGGKQRPELLDFVGDWPSEGQMEQRQVRRRERQEDKKVEGGSSAEAENNAKEKKARRGLEVTELQKLLDLIQTGVDLTHTGSSPEFILSSSSAEKSDDEEGEGGRSQGSHGNGFKRKQREQSSNRGDSGRSDLPDCVLDWTEDNSSLSREPSQSVIAESGGEEIVENVDSRTREGTAGGSESNDHNACFSYLVVDSLITSEIVGEKVSRDEEGLNFRGEPGSGADAGLSDKDQHCTDADSHPKFSSEADGIDVVFSHSPLGEGSVESESGSFSGGSQEHKRRHSRRSGKQCKLALTFTQNCPLSSLQSPQATGQNRNVGEGSTDLNINSNINININSPPDCDLSLDLQTTPDPCPILNPVPNTGSQLPSHSLNAMVETGCYTQTEPQDFALLWRVCLQNTDDTVATLGDFSSDIAILPTDPFRFLPAMSGSVSAEAAAHPSATSEVPYRMVHEKGTQVEEKELGVARSRVEDMRILSRHFKLVSFDTLEDLYDKCHQDLDWTTNLLLDSGERFFREDVEGGEGGLEEDSHNTSALKVDASESAVHIEVSSNADCPQAGPAFGVKMCEELATGEGSSQAVTTASESGDGVCTNPGSTGVGVENMSASNTQDISEKVTGGIEGALSQVGSTNEDRPDERSHSVQLPQPLLGLQKAVEEEGALKTKNKSTPKAVGGRLDDGRLFEDLRVKYGVEEVSDIDDATLLLLAELEEMDKREGDQMSEEVKSRRDFQERSSSNLVIQSLELNLPTELALQLTELFGPVGIDPGACSGADRAVQMDLHLAKLLHQKWKDTIKERQRQVALSYHLLQESSVHWGDAASTRTSSADFLIDADGFASLVNQLDAQDELPFMDHWSVYRPCVSLRDIMSEEQVRQQNLEKTRQSRADLDRRDGATLMKENQLYSLFPTIDRHFLQDIFRDHNYSLRETELFLHSLLDEGPVKTVVAPETPRTEPPRTPSKERDKRQNRSEPAVPQYQEMEDPEYEDFRAEARLQKSRQLENLAKAAEAFKQGRKDVASFYAQQGHLHSQRMHEANHRAAIQIFERVNSSLLPKNILDLHGLHVDEALQHLERVLHDKITEYQQGLCRPQLSVITGRGNHSQGGVARIRPAVIDYLTNKHYRFNEPTQGLVLVSLN